MLDQLRPDVSARRFEFISVKRLAGALGAEISGVDLATDLAKPIIVEIRQALLDNLVIFFRDQDIGPAEHLTFARRFGTVAPYPMIDSIQGFPEISPVTKLPNDRTNFGGIWHTDTTYLDEPPMGTILVARELPPYGGDTEFANMYLAYDTLSDGMKSLLDRLHVVQSSVKANAARAGNDQPETQMTDVAKQGLYAEHPATTTHPETGRKVLFVNRGHSERFAEMTQEESAPILNYLFEHQRRPEFTCRFQWTPGSIAFWDNRCTQHNPVNDYHGYKRLMHRITISGEKPKR